LNSDEADADDPGEMYPYRPGPFQPDKRDPFEEGPIAIGAELPSRLGADASPPERVMVRVVCALCHALVARVVTSEWGPLYESAVAVRPGEVVGARHAKVVHVSVPIERPDHPQFDDGVFATLCPRHGPIGFPEAKLHDAVTDFRRERRTRRLEVGAEDEAAQDEAPPGHFDGYA